MLKQLQVQKILPVSTSQNIWACEPLFWTSENYPHLFNRTLVSKSVSPSLWYSDPCDIKPLHFKTSLSLKTVNQPHHLVLFSTNILPF